MLTSRTAFDRHPNPPAVETATALAELVGSLDLESRLPFLTAAVDRAQQLFEDGEAALPSFEDGAAHLAQALADGAVDPTAAAEQVATLAARKATGGDAVRRLFGNAARLVAQEALDQVRAAAPKLHATLAKSTTAAYAEATRLAAAVPAGVDNDAAAFRAGESCRKAWLRLEVISAQLERTQTLVDLLRDSDLLPDLNRPGAATANPQHLHYRQPYLLPRRVSAAPARRLLEILPAEPCELTWDEYLSLSEQRNLGFENVARRSVGMPEVRLKHQPNPHDLASIPTDAA